MYSVKLIIVYKNNFVTTKAIFIAENTCLFILNIKRFYLSCLKNINGA